MKHALKRMAQAILAVALLGSVVVLLGAPGLLASAALLGVAALAGLGLARLGTFNK